MELQFYSFLASALVESCIGRLILGQPATDWLGERVSQKQPGLYAEENKSFSLWKSNHDTPVIWSIT